MRDYYLVLDTETGGLDPDKNPLLQIYAAVFDKKGKRQKDFEIYIKPDNSKNISIGALKVNDLLEFMDSEDCVKYSEYGAAKEFLKWCIKIQRDYNPILLGQNLKFDLAFIKKLMDNNGFTDWNDLFYRHPLDTGVLAQAMIDAGLIQGLRRTSLNALAYAFRVPADKNKLHNAKYDAEITMKVYLAMIECLQTAEGVSVDESTSASISR